MKIPFQFLAPLTLLQATIGAYVVRGLTIDIVMMFEAGSAGFSDLAARGIRYDGNKYL